MATRKKTTKKKVSSARNPLLDAIDTIGKAGLDEHLIDLDPNTIKEPLKSISSGSVILDRAIGGKKNLFGVIPCAGFPAGGVINLYGHESSGKTTLALSAAAALNKQGKTVLYIDWENEICPDYAAKIGVAIDDPSLFKLAQPETLEQGMKMIWTASHHGVDLIVIDSVGTAIPEEVMTEQSLKEKGNLGRVGLVAAKWSKFLPQNKYKQKRSGSVIIGISQLRSKIGGMGMGPTHTVQGGKIWQFQSAIRIMLRKIKTLKEKQYDPISGTEVEEPVGLMVKAKLDKCKVGSSQGKECIFQIRQGEGIDNIGSYINIAINNKLIKKGGAWLTYIRTDGTEVKCQGMSKLRKKILEDETLYQELQDIVMNLLYEDSSTEEESTLDDMLDSQTALDDDFDKMMSE
jgi:recombination protein RecA